MIYLIISILASVSVSVLLKIARQKNIHITQAVAFNYPVATLLSFIFLQPDFATFEWKHNWWLFGSLGFLLPLVFVLMGMAVQKAGIVRSDAAQRLSLVLTLLIAFFVWDEPANIFKIAGVILALIALGFLLFKPATSELKPHRSTFYLILVWLGYGTIDLIFKLISKTSGNTFSTTLTSAFILSAILIFVYLLIKKTKFNRTSVIGGVILGVLNFTNIYTYITAHKYLGDSPSLVFTGMNIGVIALGTIVGVWIFKEKLNRFNYIGVGLAIIAIVILFLQINQ